MMQSALPLILLCSPGDKRTAGIQQARSRLGLPPALTVPYGELLEGVPLSELLERQLPDAVLSGALEQSMTGIQTAGPTPERPERQRTEGRTLLRLESPGGSFALERALIALGAPDAGEQDDSLHPFGQQHDPYPLSVQAAGQLKELPGVLHHPSQWFRGYCRLLARVQWEASRILPAARWQNHPGDIAAMTDKRRTQQLLAAAGVPVPRPLGGAQPPADYESLRGLMLSERMHRVFIKLACGSAASGVIAYQINPATGAELAVTTIGVEQYITRPPVYYNSGKLRRYTVSSVLSGIINWLYSHGAYTEQWIPKAGSAGVSFDIRQLVVLGEAGHSAARVSTTPITNLHLRSKRMTPAEAGLTDEEQHQVRRTAVQALSAFPRSAIAGIDVLVSSGSSRRTYVADVNPFGDLLYDVEYEGCSTYEWEMKKLMEHRIISS
ncbi:STM4014 family protein [Paenibacillus camerounensis]|uniref:STM4014 family protein n=1 Tax=Paenibacillus camerounensis TaxID=1243663 RepID=UPI000A6E7FA8|nr:STM4014 family protein [Paenibacillus camerounensis]